MITEKETDALVATAKAMGLRRGLNVHFISGENRGMHYKFRFDVTHGPVFKAQFEKTIPEMDAIGDRIAWLLGQLLDDAATELEVRMTEGGTDAMVRGMMADSLLEKERVIYDLAETNRAMPFAPAAPARRPVRGASRARALASIASETSPRPLLLR